MTDEKNRITDESCDPKYYVMTPRLVWALSRSPYDYTLWCVLKDIAGENGECFLSTPQLAALAMMSTGKVSDCRKYLIKVGLLDGEFRQDPGCALPVWHISIPNLWPANIKWAENHLPMDSRFRYKQWLCEQRAQNKLPTATYNVQQWKRDHPGSILGGRIMTKSKRLPGRKKAE